MRTITKLLPAVALALLAPGARAAEPNTLTDAEKAAGWKLLFDGKTADHWRNYNQDKLSDKWVVKDGALTLGKGGGEIITK